MTNATNSARRHSGLTLVCVCALLFVWAAPAYAPQIWQASLVQPLSDWTSEQSETSDTTDDPAWLFFDDLADLQSLTFSLHTTRPVRLVWTPAPPVRPPALHT